MLAQSDGVIQPYGDSPLDEEALAETVYLNIINQAMYGHTDYRFPHKVLTHIQYDLQLLQYS